MSTTAPVGNTKTERIARCACGALRVRCTGDPSLVSLCHCLECQRRTGGPFGVAAFFARDAVTSDGASRVFRRPSDSGHDVTFHFCPQCGSTVYWLPERKPGVIAVAVGAFADPDFPPPTQAVYAQRRHHWIPIPVEDR